MTITEEELAKWDSCLEMREAKTAPLPVANITTGTGEIRKLITEIRRCWQEIGQLKLDIAYYKDPP